MALFLTGYPYGDTTPSPDHLTRRIGRGSLDIRASPFPARQIARPRRIAARHEPASLPPGTPPMTRPMPALALVLGVLGTSAALADAPQIGSIQPLGVRRGTAADVTISGANLLGNPRLVAPFAFTDGPAQDAGRRPGEVDLRAQPSPPRRPSASTSCGSGPRTACRTRSSSPSASSSRSRRRKTTAASRRPSRSRRPCVVEGTSAGHRRRLLPLPRQEGPADRRRRPVRPDRLGRRPARSG